MSELAKVMMPQEIVIDNHILQELRKQSPYKIFLLSLLNISTYLLLSLGGIWINSWWLWLFIWWYQGLILAGFYGANHECIHGSFVKTNWMNHLAGVLWSLPVLMNFSINKYHHLEHHKYTNIPGDTEPPKVFLSFWNYVYSLITAIHLVIPSHLLAVQACFGKFPDFIHTEKARREVQGNNLVLLLWLLLIMSATCLWTKSLLFFYWCPLIVHIPILFWLLIPEHYGCVRASNSLCNIRTAISNFFVRCAFWNANYHAEHHLYPSVPAHNLPRIHALIGRHLKFQERSYTLLHLKLIWRLLHNKFEEKA